MMAPLSILLIAAEADAQFVAGELKFGGLEADIVHVADGKALDEVLAKQNFDIVLADYSIPGCPGLAALKLIHDHDLDLPCVVFSTIVGEEAVVEAMRAGAKDYLMKSNLSRLAPVIQRAVKEAENRRARRRERHRSDVALNEAKVRLQVLSNHMIEIQEAERRHIARELHDEIGQALTAVKIHLSTAKRRVSEEAGFYLQESIWITELALSRVRELSVDLRPVQLDDLGLVAALRWQLDRQLGMAGIAINFLAEPELPPLSAELQTACFRIAQEAITNVLRHASATEVELRVGSTGESLTLMIQDDGRGFDLATARRRSLAGGSIGLIGMEERAALMGGKLDIQSGSKCGARITVTFPLFPSQARAGLAEVP